MPLAFETIGATGYGNESKYSSEKGTGLVTHTEQIWNGNGTLMKLIHVHVRNGNIPKMENHKPSCSSEHVLVSYTIRVLTKDLETMQF